MLKKLSNIGSIYLSKKFYFSCVAENTKPYLDFFSGEFSSELDDASSVFKDMADIGEVGRVTVANDGVAYATGLLDVKLGELVSFPEVDEFGMVAMLHEEDVGIVIFGNNALITEGLIVCRQRVVVDTPVGEGLLGTVVNGIGEPLDIHNPVKLRMPVEKKAPGLIYRAGVNKPVQTGMLVVDTLFPIGRGQRQLIIGNRQTGKTAVALDVIYGQAKAMSGIANTGDGLQINENLYCVYVATGKKQSAVAQIKHKLDTILELDSKDGNIFPSLKYSVIVSASAASSAPLQYLSPFTGCTIGEYFRDRGQHALVIYDDLTKQAIAYRQMSLLLRRPPGREAYPGDIFYTHSRLLERASNLSLTVGGGSLTALPIIETQMGDLASYIPTNVISITDGQLLLDTVLFNNGIRPAVNLGLSVSRVGSKAQTAPLKQVVGTLKHDLAEFRANLGSGSMGDDVDPVMKAMLDKGERITEVFVQPRRKPLTVSEQIFLVFGLMNGCFLGIDTSNVTKFKDFVLKNMRNIKKLVRSRKKLTKEVQELMLIHYMFLECQFNLSNK
eukprot:JP445930.1.p1 GENE.JP445930.1~~JP445930.1.p1  ORF type:complete len:556 (+),score=-58.49 JP445930.1:191-1858(+)